MVNILNFKYIGSRIPRIDARDKATGATKYSTDLFPEGILRARVLRSRYPHAEILRIDTTKAGKLPGVEAVLTHKDVPGYNGFGIMTPNWPVLCWDKVRYRGDALALIAAQNEEIAEEALSLIEVDYKVLPPLDTPEESLSATAPKIHDTGNIMYSHELTNGNVEKGLAASSYILEANYFTQFMEHAYLETEGGIGIYDELTGEITIWCGNQYAFRDQMQIARALNWDPEKVRVIGSPTGGAFGGKDEISVQIHLALLALHTKKPVRLHWNRSESIIAGPKRHAFKSFYKVGAGSDGRLEAIEVTLEGNTGPYDTIGPAVLNAALQTAPMGYKFPHTCLKGRSVYTNNTMGGEFRGFGTPQVMFAIEQIMDQLAEHFKMDPIEYRLLNTVKQGDRHAIGHILELSMGLKATLEAAQETDLWQRKEKIKEISNQAHPRKRYGIGVASAIGPMGLGAGLPDFSNIILKVGPSGVITLKTGATELGQGNITAYAQMVADALEYDIDKIQVIHGDTGRTPDSGSVTASRSIHCVGNAILNGVSTLIPKLIRIGAQKLNLPEENLEYRAGEVTSKMDPGLRIGMEELADWAIEMADDLIVYGAMRMVEADASTNIGFGFGIPHCHYIFVTQLALVGVDLDTGEVEVKKIVTIPDVGRAINPAGVEGQCEGAVIMGQGYALYEEVMVEGGEFLNPGFSTYILPTAMDAAEHETIIVEEPLETGPFGAKGIGEPPTSPVAPAIANAIYDAVGIRITELPITPEKLWTALKRQPRLG